MYLAKKFVKTRVLKAYAVCCNFRQQGSKAVPRWFDTSLFGFDTFADVSVVGDKSILCNFRTIHELNIQGVGGATSASGIGDLHLHLLCDNGEYWNVTIRDVIYIPGCENLICADDLCQNNMVTKTTLLNSPKAS